jgi:DNA invertase Pin-like site-specific DNA recombinase/DNA-binding XRE family transcriptional regulator
MINDTYHQKVRPEHLKRDAYLYIRQSTIQQVFHNTESTKRQYDLRRRATALGWADDNVIVIDSDLGQSGASAKDREGFQRLVADVGMGKAGIVLGLEVSRLARNSSDWHRLLEICALTDTLILDEDGLYDPGHFNDRLLLGMKGTMSEAELHIIRARLRGGILHKAGRGELRMLLPIGFTYDISDKVILTPDRQIQDALRIFFKTYERTGSASAIVKYFSKNDLQFPRLIKGRINDGKMVWVTLTHSRCLNILHNPRYAGAFVYGRTKTYKQTDGRIVVSKLPIDQWNTLITNAHPGYITWEQYTENLKTLQNCSRAYGKDRRNHPPGNGPALLQGLIICGICGHRMTLRYHKRNGKLVPDYVCQKHGIEYGRPACQCIPGVNIDNAIEKLLLESVKPVTLEIAFTVQKEIQQRLKEADKLRYQKVQRTQYQADLAKERFMNVDPRNRLVADQLEADWNDKLRTLAQARQEYEQQHELDKTKLDKQCREKILSLVKNFPKVWKDPATSDQQRKRIVRLIIEDVTLVKSNGNIEIGVRFKGGATCQMCVPVPLNGWQAKQTRPEIMSEIDKLMDHFTDKGIAENLNQRGIRPSEGEVFTTSIIGNLRRYNNLKSRYDRLREKGLLTVDEMAKELGVSTNTVKIWRRNGLLKGYKYNDRGWRLFELGPKEAMPQKQLGLTGKLTERPKYEELVSYATNGVQFE